jgi:16S rRNA (uracil1498-N3)-methyltransferase
MHRFFLPETQLLPDRTISLPAEVMRHLRTVLRLTAGSECEILDGAGQLARARILEQAEVRILSVEKITPPYCRLSLIQGLPKGEKLELVLQKGTELGVAHFLPTQMERSVSRVKTDREQKRRQRWEKIIQEAARQSRQPYLPQLQLSRTLESALSAVEADLKLLLWEESGQPLEQVLPATAPRSVAVIVGPEGGITSDEALLAQTAGYLPVSIGPRILRTETAGLAIITVLQYLYGDLAKGRCSRDAASQGKDES